MIPKTLYARMAVVLVVLFALVAVLYALISNSAIRHYLDQVNLQLNRDLAQNLVADRNLVAEGRIDEAALKETFQQYMVINPSIEIYLLDRKGNILSYSADPGKVKRRRVSLEPIEAFIREDGGRILLGDDPRSHDRQKAFSVTPVPSTEHPEGYLYVVLSGEEFEAADKVARESFLLRLSGWSVVASLGFGLLAGLLLFRLLTRRLRQLSTRMEGFNRNDFALLPADGGYKDDDGDEVDGLGITFERMAVRIQDQLHQLKSQDSLRRRLVAQVSHDLRTPLTSMQGYLESLSLKGDDLSAAEREEYLATALRQSRRLSRLLDELFELAALEARETLPRPEAFSPAELVQDVVQKYQLMASRESVGLEMITPGPLPFVNADIGLTERVLENLIENAFSHTPRGGAIFLELTRDGEQVKIAVRDSGKGIASADIDHIFDPFYQVRGQVESGRHAGLGLAIARRIIELQGGTIWAERDVPRGAVIVFTLPVS
ncbi:MAG: HAMP domain-containing histidine kinase [Gammaproteobacteria bacterium]|nr:HAMP domain-containing histidine kinase [Gammaproteobacteria bacterium]